MPNENENETKTVEPEQKPAPATVDEFLAAAKEAKENTVSKEDYDKIVAERNKLMKSILDGEKLEKEAATSKPDIAELKRIFKDPDSSNLQIVTASLGIREAVIEKTGKDPFAAKPEENKRAAEVAGILQQCVDEANGDDEKFVYLLNSHLAEDDPTLIAAINKRKAQEAKARK